MNKKLMDPTFMYQTAFLGLAIAFVISAVILTWRLSPVSLNSRLHDLEKRIEVLEKVKS